MKVKDLICVRETYLNLPIILNPMQNILVFTSKKPRCFLLVFFSSSDDEKITIRVYGAY
jgi:hypothetical protein